MIPSFTTSHFNRPDLTDRMLASIDVPIERAMLVDNSRSGYRPNVGPEWRVFEPPFSSFGWPGTLNFGIVQMADAPWWLFANNDVAFAPGVLATIAALMSGAEGTRIVTHRWSVFALNRAVVERVGLFDEWSFWPLYFDDTDYARRCALAGDEILYPDLGISEGADGFDTSMTINSDAELASRNNVTWIINEEAYREKWGGNPGRETFDTPWNAGGHLWSTRPSVNGRVARSW